MSILFDLMTLTYSATLTFPVAFPDLYKASRAIYVPVRPMPALSMYRSRFERIHYIKTYLFKYTIRGTNALKHWIMWKIRKINICYFKEFLCSLRNIFFYIYAFMRTTFTSSERLNNFSIKSSEEENFMFTWSIHVLPTMNDHWIIGFSSCLPTCSVQPLVPGSDWSWFSTRDCGTPPEREDPGYRGQATWCNGTVLQHAICFPKHVSRQKHCILNNQYILNSILHVHVSELIDKFKKKCR